MNIQIYTSNPKETEKIGEIIGKGITPPFLLALFGELGSGKTTFLKGVAKSLNISKIRSPSFIMVGEYSGKFNVHHVDLYRLNSGEELVPLGLLDIIFDINAIVFIEWAERVSFPLPQDRIEIRLSILSERERKIEMKSCSKKAESILLSLSQTLKWRGDSEKI